MPRANSKGKRNSKVEDWDETNRDERDIEITKLKKELKILKKIQQLKATINESSVDDRDLIIFQLKTEVELLKMNVDVLKVLCHSVLGPGKYAAIMYFYGYLNKVLPVPEFPEQAELAKRIKIFESEQKIKIPIKKLFILNPKSGRTEPIIGKNSDMIDNRRGLPPLELQRAGVDRRSYNHSVYKLFLECEDKSKIGIERKHVNVVAEYASPLATIKDLSQYMPEGKELLECNLSTFTEQLNVLLEENPHCGKYCEVVSFDDNEMDAVTALRSRVLQILEKQSTNNKVPEKSQWSSNSEYSLENDLVQIN